VKTTLIALFAISTLSLVPAVAQDYGHHDRGAPSDQHTNDHRGDNGYHGRHKVCVYRHHRRVCSWR
jgi:hypothetical protein